MDVKPGYKLTEVGEIPLEWCVVELSTVCERISVGLATSVTKHYRRQGVPIVRNLNIKKGYFSDSDMLYLAPSFAKANSAKAARARDVLTVHTGANLGDTCVLPETYDSCQTFTTLITTPNKERLDSDYLCLHMSSAFGKSEMERLQVGGGKGNLNTGDLKRYRIALPQLAEQKAVAKVSKDTNTLIESLEQLVAKKRQIKHGAMQELLTGKKRLPGYSGEWDTMPIADIAEPRTEKNTSGIKLPVLSCSKHLGFVDSLRYFKNQVFSDDLTNYKIIHRGDIGYPANHVEEGSIGLQDLYDVALVSPIYVVFETSTEVNSFFLHRLLKLDAYRHRFETATDASVDRRGSLRWPAFSRIPITIPRLSEQDAIAGILTEMETEIASLDAKLSKARHVKDGMMQELLTGRIRLVKCNETTP